MRAIVVGAGIGGLTAAIALRRVGVDARVYEQAPELAEASPWARRASGRSARRTTPR